MTSPAGHLPQRPPRALEWRALIPLAAAVAWIAGGSGWAWWLCAALPVAYLLAASVALFAKIHDLRVHQLHAAGGFLGTLLAIPALFIGGADAVLAGALSAWAFVTAGRIAVEYEPRYHGAQEPEAKLAVDAKAALDETVLAYFVGVAKLPAGSSAEAMCLEALRLEAVLKEQGWTSDIAGYHQAPRAPEAVVADPRSWRGINYERVSYPSGFLPRPELPGAAAWSAHPRNPRMQLRVFRHPGGPRPWLMCVHGYRMGVDWMDFSLFDPGWLHRKLGLNLIMPVLPLHGVRRTGRQSGDHYLDGDLLDLLHAQTQALWDLRKALAWLRDREPGAQVGVYGVSLGGYNASLLATAESDLSFVVGGVPLADVARALWRNLPQVHERFYAQHGLSEARYREILRPVSPLARPALPAAERLHLFAATADRLVTPDHPLKLSAHWQRPVHWYQGSHLSIRRERVTREVVELAVKAAGWK